MFKKLKNQKYASIAYYAVWVIALCIALVFVLNSLDNIWAYIRNLITAVTAFIYGFVIAYICNPIYKKLHTYVFAFIEKKKAHPKLRKTFSLIFTYIIFFGIIAIIVFSLIPSFGDNFTKLANNIGSYLNNAMVWVTDLFENLKINIPILDSQKIIDTLTNFLKELDLTKFATIILNTGVSIVQQIIYFVIGLILSVYFLMYKHSMTAKIRKLLCAMFSKKTYNRICEFAAYTDRTFGRYLMGAALDSLLVGTIVVVVLSILGYEFAPLIGVVVGITNIIPFFGPFLGAVPSALIILIADGPIKMLIFVIFILVLQQIDGNIINPHIVGATTGLTPIGVIASVTVCSHIFGFIGMVIGVPLFAVLTYIVSEILDNRLKKKNLPSDTKLFKNKDIYANEAFINASLEVEAMNLIEQQQDAVAMAEEAEKRHTLVMLKHEELLYAKAHPEEVVEEPVKKKDETVNDIDEDIVENELDSDGDNDDDDYLDD
ncbi:MAG: AI-2E family transporter [Clostridia bacterium]|nr:AI-2E family transporter [Clostridia bacterium]